VYTGTEIDRIENRVAVLTRNGEKIEVPVGSIVLAVGAESVDDLCGDLEAAGIECFKIGDCVSPRRIQDAVHEGFRIGSTL
jgi:hypothetical protein